MTTETRKLEMVSMDRIVPGDNDRQVFDAARIRELADSIESDGQIQPVTLRPRVDGMLEIVAGERRVRAMQLLGRTVIEATVQDLDDETAASIMLLENVSRVDLNPIDEAKAYRTRIDRFGWTINQCAEKAHVTAWRVQCRLDLLGLCEDIQFLLQSNQLGMSHALVMAKLDFNRQHIALRYYSSGRKPTIEEFREICGQLFIEQSQEKLFDDFEMKLQEWETDKPQKAVNVVPTAPHLPAMRIRGTLRNTFINYIRQLAESGDPAQIAAIPVIGVVIQGMASQNWITMGPEQIKQIREILARLQPAGHTEETLTAITAGVAEPEATLPALNES